jgi:hypothetical protein
MGNRVAKVRVRFLRVSTIRVIDMASTLARPAQNANCLAMGVIPPEGGWFKIFVR